MGRVDFPSFPFIQFLLPTDTMGEADILKLKSFKRSVNFEMSFWCLQIDQKTNEIFVRIFALAYKKRSNENKIRALYTTNWMILF